MNVLHIDDETDVHTIMSSFLQRYGLLHEKTIENNVLVDPVQGLFEALNHGHKYDLILLDVRLPQLTGGEIYQNIAQNRPDLLDRVLFVTAFREELDGRFPDQQLNVLDKPFRYTQLEEKIQSMVN
jgi:CheY-like chemotaxis protein